jgi:hypothetical protein
VEGSDIWWIRYKVEGVEHREKVGRFSDAVDLYRIGDFALIQITDDKKSVYR